MNKFEMLRESPKCAETRSEHTLWKMAQTCSRQRCRKPSICKNAAFSAAQGRGVPRDGIWGPRHLFRSDGAKPASSRPSGAGGSEAWWPRSAGPQELGPRRHRGAVQTVVFRRARRFTPCTFFRRASWGVRPQAHSRPGTVMGTSHAPGLPRVESLTRLTRSCSVSLHVRPELYRPVFSPDLQPLRRTRRGNVVWGPCVGACPPAAAQSAH